jgi:hypothetical protein
VGALNVALAASDSVWLRRHGPGVPPVPQVTRLRVMTWTQAAGTLTASINRRPAEAGSWW